MLLITDNLDVGTLTIMAGLFAGAVIVVIVSKKGYFDDAFEQLSGTQSSGTYLEASSRDETFDWINNKFLADDKKQDREIVDERGVTRHQFLSISTSDGTDYVYRAFLAPYQNSEEFFLFIVVDCMTMTVVMDGNVKKKSQLSDDMFETCPEVKRMRKMNSNQGLTTEQLRQKTQQMAVNPMMAGIYGGGGNPGSNQNSQKTSDDGSDDEGGE